MIRKAFTMLELVIVIVVLGILAALAIPRLERDLKQEAADNILSAIRYTQHLALMDNKHDVDQPDWQKAFWKIQFVSSSADTMNNFYTICSDISLDGTVQKSECALDPANGKYYYNAGGATTSMQTDETPSIFIGKKYGINDVSGQGGCDNIKHIGFDHLGRPHVSFAGSSTPDYSSYMKEPCQFTFSMENGGSFTITVEPETGYAYIEGQPDS